jgi:hypothetical protein
MNGLDELKRRYPWPETCPSVPANPDGWFCGENRAVLQRRIADAYTVLEIGAWLGLSTRFLVDNSPGTVITIDHWKGSSEHKNMPELATLWETFCKNCWKYRGRLIPAKTSSIDGMREIHSLGISPDVIYIDASHEAELVAADLRLAIELWPKAHIVGDDWNWTTVKAGVCSVLAGQLGLPNCRKFVGRFTCYEFFPEGADVVA